MKTQDILKMLYDVEKELLSRGLVTESVKLGNFRMSLEKELGLQDMAEVLA